MRPAENGANMCRMVEKISKSARTRERILDAAAEVFGAHGYPARLVDIAERAGIQTGSLYYHFENRDDLVREVLRRGVDTTWAHVRTEVDALPSVASSIDRLRTAIRAHAIAVLVMSPYAWARARIAGQAPAAIGAEHRAHHARYGDYIGSLVQEAHSDGHLRAEIDPYVATMLVLGALSWTTEWFDPNGTTLARDVANHAVRMTLDGIAQPPA